MTRFLSLRTQNVGGSVQRPIVVDCKGTAPFTYTPVNDAVLTADIAGRDVVLAVHGFNVSRPDGAAALAQLEFALALGPNHRFFGVLWPGDFWLPVVNYPWGASIAVATGRYLAADLNARFARASSISLISHSLGARVLLEAAQGLHRLASELCLTAGAVDRDCLEIQYAGVRQKAGRISVLSSEADKVLRLAYPAGDFISDLLLGDKDSPWQGALGLKGPKRPIARPLVGEPIARNAGFDGKGFDHGDYFPPSKAPPAAPADPKWRHAVGYMRRAILGQASSWL